MCEVEEHLILKISIYPSVKKHGIKFDKNLQKNKKYTKLYICFTFEKVMKAFAKK